MTATEKQGRSDRADPVVILGGPPYQPSANQTSLQMFHALSRNHPVLYVCRRSQATHLPSISRARNRSRVDAFPPGLHNVGPRANVLVLPTVTSFLPMVAPEFARRLSLAIVWVEVWRALRKLGMDRPRLLAYWWMFPELVNSTMWSIRVFDVIDRHWGYDYLSSERIRYRNRDLAVQTSKRSEETVCVSEGLSLELKKFGVATTILHNGISIERVRRAAEGFDGVREPKSAVYVGGWNDRIDTALLHSLINANPDWKFRLAGGDRTQEFAAYPNVEAYGSISYDDALALMLRSRVGLLPFRANAFTGASNFMKVLDYLATGLHIASSDMDSMASIRHQFPTRVSLLVRPSDWRALFRQLAETTMNGEAAEMGDWSDERRASDLLRLMETRDS